MRSVHIIALTVLLLANTACMQKREMPRITSTDTSNEEIVILSQGKAQIASTVPLRHNPSVKSGTIRYLRAGESVSILGKVNRQWIKVADKSRTIGYVHFDPKFIKINSKIQFLD